jgi:outer membrane biosynthesis protein TonB
MKLWGLVLLSLVFIYEQKPPEPQRIEVQFLKLPAPLEGGTLDIPRATRSGPKADAAHVTTIEPVDRPRERVPKRRGPRVEYRVRVARTTAHVAVRESGTWVPASRIRLRETAVHDLGSRLAGVSPDAPPNADRRPSSSGRGSSSEDRGSASDGSASDCPGPLDVAGGDARELIKIIQARIDAVTPLIHASAGPCQSTRGVVHLKFVVNRAGYPGGFRIISSSGVRCLDDEVDNVLHMAEPYPYVAGWIPVTVRFAPRTSI